MEDTVEDVKNELRVLATFLDDGFFGQEMTDEQRNLLIELVVLKMKTMAK